MDDNPFEIPPLLSSKGLAVGPPHPSGGEENAKPGTNKISLQHYKHQRQALHRPHGGQKSSASPTWNGKFSSSIASPSMAPPQSMKYSSSGGNHESSARPLRSLKQSSSRFHHSSPQSRISSPFSLSSAGAILPKSSSRVPNSSTLSRSASKLQDSVLRSGETMNGFFCVTHDSSHEYIQLVESLVDGSRAYDPYTWRCVLDMASRQQPDGSLYLVRMYRRATMRFRLEWQELSLFSDERQRHHVLEIWVNYALTYAKTGNIVEAQQTFRHIQNKSNIMQEYLLKDREGAKIIASCYLAFATFEYEQCHDQARAKEIILCGIQETNDSEGALKDYLNVLGCADGSEVFHRRTTPIPSDDSLRGPKRSPQTSTTPDDRTNRSPLSMRKLSAESRDKSSTLIDTIGQQNRHTMVETTDGLPKRKRQSKNDAFYSPKRRKSEDISSSQMNCIVLTKENEAPSDNKKIKNKSEATHKNDHIKHVSILSPPNPKAYASKAIDVSTAEATPAAVTSTETSLAGKPPGPSAKRSSLTSRLARKGLSGAPKRVGADQSLVLNDDKTSDDSDQESACGQEETNVPSFKSMDLSYIWSWKPKGLTNNGQQEGSTGSGQSTHGSGDSSNHSGAASKLKRNDEQQKKEQPASSEATTQQVEAKTLEKVANPNKAPVVDADTPAVQAKIDFGTPSREQELLARANLEFLPLVHEDNILRVNNSSYVKLGVIGKGGSCKVYRALSKKCSVVAIKKVKLDGMTKKAIEGYANEISLLKRLKGNSSIIRMYDSELDLQRKSIFVVMELGEVDLSYVLEQRAQAKTSKSLDMNFIRLTWQQMLNAVHSIHEAKIIHSDLKPANFLFVRGALKLIDFGIAKAIANPEDTTKIVRESQIGTLNYMSPESILDTGEGNGDGPRMKIGRASDVWSLGCILYEMVYGKTPFAKYHMIVKLQAIINENHKIKFPDAGESAEGAIDAMKQCLHRRPEDRPPIVGNGGLLNEHWFLHSNRQPLKSK